MRAGPAVIAAVVGILACAAWHRWPVAARQVVNDPPRHIALIPDGNRRWARSHGLSVAQGHRAGMSALGPVAAAAWDEEAPRLGVAGGHVAGSNPLNENASTEIRLHNPKGLFHNLFPFLDFRGKGTRGAKGHERSHGTARPKGGLKKPHGLL